STDPRARCPDLAGRGSQPQCSAPAANSSLAPGVPKGNPWPIARFPLTLAGGCERLAEVTPIRKFRCSGRLATLLSPFAILFAILSIAWTDGVPPQEPDARRPDQGGYASELPRIPPKSPAESLEAFRVHPGFRVELAAAEPLLASPVALDFDE